jgi:hypothetical protein
MLVKLVKYAPNSKNSHKFDINHYPETTINVSELFNSRGHTIKDFSFMPIDKVTHHWKIL